MAFEGEGVNLTLSYTPQSFALYEAFEYMTREESWNSFIDELRAYVQEHHHFPNKHTRLLSKVKYTRKKINNGTLEDWKKQMFMEVANMRDMEEHCGGIIE